MLKRLIENWLTSVSEREFDIPFRLLLEAEGHVSIGHSTVHGPMELGKDIVSWHPEEEIFYFFQLKAGNANLHAWNDMERQIRQLVEVPYTHPNYTIGLPYKPVWVCTGQLDETVRFSLGGKNEEHRRYGKPSIEVWERNMLIEKYVEMFFKIVFVDDYFLVDFLKVWSHARDFMMDEDDLRVFFHQYLSSCPLTNVRKAKLCLATYALMLAQLSQRYVSIGDLFSGIDCLLLGVVQVCEIITTNELQEEIYGRCYSVINELILVYLQGLADECAADEDTIADLFDPTPSPSMSEIFELPLRTHSLASKLALLQMLKSFRGEDTTVESRMLDIVIEKNHAAFCHIVSERQMGTLWVSIIGLLYAQNQSLAQQCIEDVFEWLMTFHGSEASRGLPDPYQPLASLVNHHLGIEPENERLINMNGQSYLLPILLKFMCYLGLRHCVERQWKTLSQMVFRDYYLSPPSCLFSYRSEEGVVVSFGFPVTGSWTEIQAWFSQRPSSVYVDFLSQYPETLLFLTLAYPWRTQWREVERYLSVDS